MVQSISRGGGGVGLLAVGLSMRAGLRREAWNEFGI